MKRLHYAWIVVLVTFLSLLAAQAVRAAPGVIITSLESEFGWTRTAISFAMGAVAIMIVPIALLMRDRPDDVGAQPLGEAAVVTADVRAEDLRSTPLRQAMRTRDFWLLAGSFFVCGYTSNGLVGTHLIPHAIDPA